MIIKLKLKSLLFSQVRAEYQTKLNELSQYPEKLSSAEARFVHAEAETEVLRSQLTDKNRTVEDLNKKIDTFQGQIAKLKDKFHAVNEDNIELSNKSQSHERFNKNFIMFTNSLGNHF